MPKSYSLGWMLLVGAVLAGWAGEAGAQRRDARQAAPIVGKKAKVMLGAAAPVRTPKSVPSAGYDINFFAANGDAHSFTTGEVLGGGWPGIACHLSLSADVRAVNDYTVGKPIFLCFRAVDSKGRPTGQINGPGPGDDSVRISAMDSRSEADFRTSAGNGAGQIMLFAQVLDAQGHILGASQRQIVKVLPVEVWVEYGRWKADTDPDQWYRDVQVFCGARSSMATYLMPLPVKVRAVCPVGSRSWVLPDRGTPPTPSTVTMERFGFTGLEIRQFVRWVPGAEVLLTRYKVEGQVVAAKAPLKGRR